MIISNKVLAEDYTEVQLKFPKIMLVSASERSCTFTGEIDIFDAEGVYWESFMLKIVVVNSYPNCIPKVYELNKRIPIDDDRHIHSDTSLCLDIEYELIKYTERSWNLCGFIIDKVYTYLSGQLYFEETKKWAGGEHRHGEKGIIDHYLKKIGTTDLSKVKSLLNFLIDRKSISIENERNNSCFCGSGKKLKQCHREVAYYFAGFDLKILKRDLTFINNVNP